MSACLSDEEIDFYFECLCNSKFPNTDWKTHVDQCERCQSRLDSERLFRDLKSAVCKNTTELDRDSEVDNTRLPVEQPVPNDDSVDIALPPLPGYEIGQKIQHGGQGIVYQAIQTATKRPVAIKFLRGGAFALAVNRSRFETEIETVANLRHANIVTIYDSGCVDGVAFYSMEFVDGMTLDRFCEEQLESRFNSGATSKEYIRETLKIFLDVIHAVAYAHRHGVIHRDLKPANIIVNYEHEPQVLDFGLAKIASCMDSDVKGSNRNQQEASGVFFGTAAYASPEQICNRFDSIDTRSDIYSLGVVLYEALTKRFPYSVSGSLFSIARGIESQPPTAPSIFNKKIDNDVEAILLKSLAKESDLRYQTAEQFALDISAYLDGRVIDARRDNRWYVLRTAIRRNWQIALSVLMTIVFLSAGLAVSNYFYRQAISDRDIAIESKAIANTALKDASVLRIEAEFQSYVANLAAASGSIQLNDVVECATRLMNVPPNMRGWEWHHFLHLLDDSVSTVVTHEAYADFVSFGGNRNQIISAGQDGQIIVSNSIDQTSRRVLKRDGNGAIAVSPDRKFLAFDSNGGKVKVYRISDFKEMVSLRTGGKLTTAISFSPDGSKLAIGIVAQPESTSQKIMIEVWDIDASQRILQIPFSKWYVNSISFSPNQKRLAAITFDGGTIWDLSKGTRLSRLPDRPGNEAVIRFAPDGDIVATGGKDGVIYLWSVSKQLGISELVGHQGEVTDIVFLADHDRLVSSSRDKTIRVWDLARSVCLKTFKGHRWAVSDIDVLGDGNNIASASWDRTIRLWDNDRKESKAMVDGHVSQVSTIDFSPDGARFASASRDQTIKIWRTHDRKLVHTIDQLGNPAHGVKFSHDGKLLATTGWNGEARVWETSNWKQVANLNGHAPNSRVHGVAFSADDQWLATGGSDNQLLIWNVADFSLKESLAGHQDHIHTVTVSPNNRFIASAGHESIRIWSTKDFSLLHVLSRKMLQDDYSLAFHPSENWLAAGADVGIIKLWDVETGEEVSRFVGHHDEIKSLDFYPDGSRLVSASFDNRVIVWETNSKRELLHLFGFSSPANVVKFGPTGFYLMCGLENGQVKVWNGISVEDLQESRLSTAVNSSRE